eukprot:5585495-Amphidinium_carterae.1
MHNVTCEHGRRDLSINTDSISHGIYATSVVCTAQVGGATFVTNPFACFTQSYGKDLVDLKDKLEQPKPCVKCALKSIGTT